MIRIRFFAPTAGIVTELIQENKFVARFGGCMDVFATSEGQTTSQKETSNPGFSLHNYFDALFFVEQKVMSGDKSQTTFEKIKG